MQLFAHLLSSYLQGMGDFFSALPKGGRPTQPPQTLRELGSRPLCKPLPNPPQREGIPHNHLKHCERWAPAPWEGWGGASTHPTSPQISYPKNITTTQGTTTNISRIFSSSTKITTMFTSKPCVLTFIMRFNGLRENDVRLEQFYLLQNVRFEHKLVRFEQ